MEYEGDYIEHQAFRAYVMGNKAKGSDFVTSTTANIVLLDVLRDPPGSNSSAYVESGTTYKYNYSSEVKFQFGLNVNFGYGTSANMTMGTYAGAGGGVYTGYLVNVNTINTVAVPIQSTYYHKHSASYTFGLTDRIETEADHAHTGEMDDIYIGAVQNLYYGLTDAVKPIDSLTYQAFAPMFADGTMQVVDSGREANGERWYLVIGLEREVGTYMSSTFAYTHDFIENTLIPKLKRDRDALLLTLDSLTIQTMADAQNKVFYWSKVMPADDDFASEGSYRQIRPSNSTKEQADEVAGYNRAIAGWVGVMIQNEKEKINAIHGYGRNNVGTWSVSGGSQVSHSEVYEYANTYSDYVDYPGASANLGQDLIATLQKAFDEKNQWLFQAAIRFMRGFIQWNPLGFVFFVVAVVPLYYVNYRLQQVAIYVEIAKAEVVKSFKTRNMVFLDKFGIIGEYLKLEIKSTMRNLVVRKQFLIAAGCMLMLCSLFSFSHIYDSLPFMRIFICVYCFNCLGVMTLTTVMCAEGNYIDGLMVHKETVLSLLKAKYYFQCLMLVVPFLFSLMPIMEGKMTWMTALGCLLFTTGVVFPFIFQLAVYNDTSIHLNKKLTRTGRDTKVQMLMSGIAMFLPMLIMWTLVNLWGDQTAAVVMAAIGLLGTLAHPLWLKNIYKRFMQRRYQNMEGFRSSR